MTSGRGGGSNVTPWWITVQSTPGMDPRLVPADRDHAGRRVVRTRALAHGWSSRPWKVAATGDAAPAGRRPAFQRIEVHVDQVEVRLVLEDLLGRLRGDTASGSPPKPGRPQRQRDGRHVAPGIRESPLAKVVTSWPRRWSSRTSSATIRSVPP